MDREEAREILASLREDLERAANKRTTPEQQEDRAQAVEDALLCLLEALGTPAPTEVMD